MEMETETLIWLGFMAILTLLIGSIIVMVIVSGVFTPIDVSTGAPYIEEVVIAYRFATGPYSNCGSYFSDSTSIGPNQQQIGIYYDEPGKIPDEKLRWAVGAVLMGPDGKLDEKLQRVYMRKGYSIHTLPKVPLSVNSTFPHVTMISILLAVWRVYPRLVSYIKDRRLKAYPIMEIYDQGNINFMCPLSDNLSFYVQESKDLQPHYAQYYRKPDYSYLEGEADPVVYEPPAVTQSTQLPVEVQDTDSDDSFEKLDADPLELAD